MESRTSKEIILVFLIFFCSRTRCHISEQHSPSDTNTVKNEINVGVILNMGSLIGKMVNSSITMAISEFYALNVNCKSKIVLHTRDSKGEPLHALTAALDLLHNMEVQAIIGPQSSLEARLLAIIGEKAKLPIFSFTPNPLLSDEHSFFFQLAQDETIQFKGIAALVESFQWMDIILIHEDAGYGRETLVHLVDSFQEKSVHIVHRCSISPSTSDDHILDELHKLMTMYTTTFVVHMAPSLSSRFFLKVNSLGMMSEGYTWIVTDNTISLLESMEFEVIESMQGVLGFKSYIPPSRELWNFNLRWRKEYNSRNPSMEMLELNVFGVWAYDATWALAMAFERVDVRLPQANEQNSGVINLMDIIDIKVSLSGTKLLDEILRVRFRGLSGEFSLMNRKLLTEVFEVVNVLGKGDRRISFWTTTDGFVKSNQFPVMAKNPFSINSLQSSIIWPGGSTTKPRGRMMQMTTKTLRIGVPVNFGFAEILETRYHEKSNKTIVRGFAKDVFTAAINRLPYEVRCEYIPFADASGQSVGSYNDLIYQVYTQNLDAVVGDITITANRSLYVDFTLPYTDQGVGTIVKISDKDMWYFLKPLDKKLWLICAGFFILTGFVVWVIEHPVNNEFQGSRAEQIGTVFWFSFSTLFYAHRQTLSSNISRFVVTIWLFIVLIMTSSYTATLSSLLTVEQIQLASKGSSIGYQSGSLVAGVIANNLNFTDNRLKVYNTPEEYADALSRGSKHGGVDAIIDEMPYLKIFLGRYSGEYAMVASQPTTNGFGFAFRKGSPLCQDISREIAGLREEGRLMEMEKYWFNIQKPPLLSSQQDNTNNGNQLRILNFSDFRGIFLISGVSSILALFIFSIYLLHQKLFGTNFLSNFLARVRLSVLLRYFFCEN